MAELLEGAEEDLLAHMGFPQQHWRQLHPTNPLERINREIKRRTNVVGIFPNLAAVIRLVGALLIEQQDDWTAGRGYFSSESMQDIRANQPEEERQLMACGIQEMEEINNGNLHHLMGNYLLLAKKPPP